MRNVQQKDFQMKITTSLAALVWVLLTSSPSGAVAEESDSDSELTGPPESSAESGGLSERCLALRDDIDADLGEVMRAGCEPTLAQMSALMDNPIGNVVGTPKVFTGATRQARIDRERAVL
jgi:hypothetical protein